VRIASHRQRAECFQRTEKERLPPQKRGEFAASYAQRWSHDLGKELVTQLRPLATTNAVLSPTTCPHASRKEQVFLTFRSEGYAIVLGSAIDPPQTRKEIRAFLLTTANSFYRSTTPMTLQFASDGSYTRKSK
jgi:hypothetical protein